MEGVEIMYLVTEGKRKENQLGYAPKTQKYVYFHNGKEIWREKGDKELLDYFNEEEQAFELLTIKKLKIILSGKSIAKIVKVTNVKSY